MSDPQPPPTPDSEIHLDLDAPGAEPEPEPEPRRRRMPNAALALMAAVITLAAAAVTGWNQLPGRATTAEQTVRDFLEAVRDGDVETALSMTDPVDGPDHFLHPEALDDRWRINEVAQVEYQEDYGELDAIAKVYTEIEAYDGTRLGQRVTVGFDRGEPTILSGYSETEYYASPSHGFLELNGVFVEVEEMLTVRLLPGVYTYYESAPETIDVGQAEVLVLGNRSIQLGGDYVVSGLEGAWPAISDAGIELLGEKLREHYDACTADPGATGCPFAPPSGAAGIEIAPDAEWTIVAYPVASATSWGMNGIGYELETTVPGAVEVEAVIEEPGGGTREAMLSCPLLVEGMHVVFDYEGGVELAAAGADDECASMVEVE